MAKFDFSNSRYAKLFGSKDNINYLQQLIDTKGVVGCNYKWYLTQGKKASTPTAISPDGTASFQVSCRALEAAPLMDMRAPLGDSLQEDTKGVSLYTATIPHFIGKGTVENAMEREYKENMFKQYGDDRDLIREFAQTVVQKKVDSVDATLTFLTAKLMSTAKADYRGIAQGIQAPIHKAEVPLENFSKAGVNTTDKIWSDPDCNILKQMKEIEDKYRQMWGTSAEFVWQMPKDMYYNIFLQNKYVIEFINTYRAMNYGTAIQIGVATHEEFQKASVNLSAYGVSRIEVVEEKVRNITETADTMIHGWEQGVAVLRPAGDATTIMWAEPSDVELFRKYGADSITKVFAKTNNGLATLVNSTMGNGQYKEWHTDILLSATPALNNFLYHVIVDTTTM